MNISDFTRISFEKDIMTPNPIFLAFQAKKNKNGPKAIDGQFQYNLRHGQSKESCCISPIYFTIHYLLELRANPKQNRKPK
jgi:hypothetical protein